MGRKVTSLSLSEIDDKFVEEQVKDRGINTSEFFQKLIEDYKSKLVSPSFLMETKRKLISKKEDIDHEIAKLDKTLSELESRKNICKEESEDPEKELKRVVRMFNSAIETSFDCPDGFNNGDETAMLEFAKEYIKLHEKGLSSKDYLINRGFKIKLIKPKKELNLIRSI